MASAVGGAFQAFDPLLAAAMRDGLSNTAAFSEKRVSGRGDDWDPETDYWYSGFAAGRNSGEYPGADELIDLCRFGVTDPARFESDAGREWRYGDFHQTLYNHAAGPNPSWPDCSALPYRIHTPEGGLHAADSYHRGGVHLSLLDGSVRFVGDPIDLAVWRAVATRAGGETVEF